MRQRTQLKLAGTLGVAVPWYVDAIADDRKLTAEDIDETLIAAGMLAGIWNEELFGLAGWAVGLPLGSMALAGTVTAIGGVIPAYAIAGESGAEDYLEFITSGPQGMIEKTMEVTVPTLVPRAVQNLYEGQVYVEKKVQEFMGWVGGMAQAAEKKFWNPIMFRF